MGILRRVVKFYRVAFALKLEAPDIEGFSKFIPYEPPYEANVTCGSRYASSAFTSMELVFSSAKFQGKEREQFEPETLQEVYRANARQLG